MDALPSLYFYLQGGLWIGMEMAKLQPLRVRGVIAVQPGMRTLYELGWMAYHVTEVYGVLRRAITVWNILFWSLEESSLSPCLAQVWRGLSLPQGRGSNTFVEMTQNRVGELWLNSNYRPFFLTSVLLNIRWIGGYLVSPFEKKNSSRRHTWLVRWREKEPTKILCLDNDDTFFSFSVHEMGFVQHWRLFCGVTFIKVGHPEGARAEHLNRAVTNRYIFRHWTCMLGDAM
jgi:hypothetical protein